MSRAEDGGKGGEFDRIDFHAGDDVRIRKGIESFQEGKALIESRAQEIGMHRKKTCNPVAPVVQDAPVTSSLSATREAS